MMRKRISVFLCIALVTAMVMGLSTVYAATLLGDDFEDGNSTGWSTNGGSWSVVTDGTMVYKQSNTSSNAYSYTGTSTWTNYSVEARVKPLSFNGTDRGISLGARFKDTSNFYFARLSNANTLQIGKRVSGSNTALTSKAYTVTVGNWYTLKLVVNGTNLDCYVNGSLELSATDTAFTTGKICLYTVYASAEFDDIKVEDTSTSTATPTPTPTPSSGTTATPTPTPSSGATATPTPVQTTPTPTPTGSTAVYYVAPTGNDSNLGTINSPFLTVNKAVEVAQPGATIYVRGGTYSNHPPIVISSAKSGTSSAITKLWAYNGENPVLDFSGNASTERGIMVNAGYWHLKGLTVTNSPQHGITIDGGSYVTLEQCTAHHNGNMGINITGGAAYCTILNCDAYHNCDTPNGGENADGFGAKYDLGPGNLFKGCRAWYNSDDGYDLWGATAAIRFEDCWAYKNGLNFLNLASFNGDGNGFKLGAGSGRHVLVRCVAWDSLLANGFEDNNNTAGVEYYNCTGYKNMKKNFEAAGTSVHIVKNNLSFQGGVADNIGAQVDNSNNSWNGFTVTSADFLSLDDSVAIGVRGTDGSLPVSNFLKLASASSLIDAGVNVGLPYQGSAPDIGAYEMR